MKFLKKMKDGGNESSVTGYWLVEIKSLFSIVLLKFEGMSGRNVYHKHAFNALSWLIKGCLKEDVKEDTFDTYYLPSFVPIYTSRDRLHMVDSINTSWVLSFRGPWSKTWEEYLPEEDRYRVLTHGRVEVNGS